MSGLVAAAHIVAPCSYEIRQRDTTVWRGAFRNLVEAHHEREVSYFAAFLLALGLSNAPPDPVSLVADSFDLVHEEARRDVLGDNVWIVIDPVVPHLSWIQDWDKCERLKRGLAVAFVQHKWPAPDLKKCVGGRLLQHVLDSARKVEGGRDYFEGLA